MNALLWIVSISTIIAILVGMLPLQSTDYPASQLANSFWFALTRNNWGYSIAWIIFACHNGSGGIIKWFLELPIWKPFGRMSLSFYLVHSLYQMVTTGSNKVPLHFSTRHVVSKNIKLNDETLNRVTNDFFFQLQSYAGDFVAATFLASILYLTLEEPILLIENYIYKRIALSKNSNWILWIKSFLAAKCKLFHFCNFKL